MNGNPGQARLRKCDRYEIRIKGHLDEHWSEWFDNMTITYDEDDNTILSGPIADQAALYGLLKKVHNLGLPLISVTQAECSATDHGHSQSKKGGLK